MRIRAKCNLLALSAAVLSACGTSAFAAADKSHDHPHGDFKEAVCVLVPTKDHQCSGTLVLTQKEGYVQVTGEVSGIKPGEHGFHIHMYGDLRSSDGSSAGGHFNPEGHPHGGPDSKEHHAGDLGNIRANGMGVAKVDIKAMGLDLHHVLGRAIVVHADKDDFKDIKSAGPRIGVGVIGLAEVKEMKK
jgi:Cu-Zn family superoxide dismutase